MLDVRNLCINKLTEERELIKNLSFTLNKHDKFAIIGLEGNGKSTLLKVLLGHTLDYIEVKGSIHLHNHRLGYLPQSIKDQWINETVLEYLLKDNPNNEIEPSNYQYLNILDKVLDELQFDKVAYDDMKKISEFSGGEVVKLGLAKILIREPDILLLDEPTNDLDLETILFLEEFIQREERPILFISHDEALLENVSTGVIHLVQVNKNRFAQSFFEKVNYKTYKEQRNLSLLSQEMIAKKQRSDFKKKIERFRQIYQKVEDRQNQAVRNPSKARLLAKKMKTLKSQEGKLDQEQANFIDIPEKEEAIELFFDASVHLPNKVVVLDMNLDELEVENRVLARNIELLIKGPQKVVLLGRNGTGKTTLLKTIYKDLQQRSNINVGYMSQNYEDQLDSNKSALANLIDPRDKVLEGRVRKIMGALDFTREEMLYKVSNLSGGQKAKLLLLKLVLDKCNVLILDEPTRNLSPLSIPVIHELLLQFKGAIICVSHDRNFIENVFDELYMLEPTGLKKL